MRSKESFALLPSSMKDEHDQDTEVAEKSPNGRYVRYDEVIGREFGATSKMIAYKGFDVGDGMEITWKKLRRVDNDLSKAAEQVEERLLKPLRRHKNIIKSYSTWVDHETETVNVITESFTSGNLREFRKKHRSVHGAVIKNWARQILQGLCYLHTHDPPIIHGDLTCENIFINGNTGEVKIGSLGLKEEENNPSVDLFSFGICMLELVSSRASESLQIEEAQKADIRILLEKVKDIQLRQFVEKCLVPDSYTMRLSSVEELLEHPFLEKTSTSLVAMGMLKEADRHPVSVTAKLKAMNERNEFILTGERRDENSASLVLRITDLCGGGGWVADIEFKFSFDTDTTISVAGEMVQELNLPMEDATLIVELMDNLIIKLVPCWMPTCGRFNGVKRSYVDPILGF